MFDVSLRDLDLHSRSQDHTKPELLRSYTHPFFHSFILSFFFQFFFFFFFWFYFILLGEERVTKILIDLEKNWLAVETFEF